MTTLRYHLDAIIAIAGIVISPALILLLSLNNSRPIYIIVVALTLISCLIWLIIRKKATLSDSSHYDSVRFKLLQIIFLMLFISSIYCYYTRANLYERPTEYYVIISLMAGLIALEAFYASVKNHYIILVQVILVGLNFSYTQQLLFPGIVGVDPWTSNMFVKNIIENGMIPPDLVNFAYSSLPLFHLDAAVSSVITNSNYKIVGIFLLSTVQIISGILFTYLLSRQLFNNIKISLLSALFFITANLIIFMNYSPIPNSYSAIFLLIATYVLLKYQNNNNSMNALVIFILIIIIMSHTITALFMAIILILIYCVYRIYKFVDRTNMSINVLMPVVFSLAMITYWLFISGTVSMFIELLMYGFSIDLFEKSPLGIISYTSSIPIIEQVLNNLGMFIFFSISFIGCFYLLAKNKAPNYILIALIGLISLIISFIGPVTGHSFVEQRWYYFAQMFLCIPLAIALVLLFNFAISKRYHIIMLTIIFCVTAIMTILMVLSPFGNIDNHVISINSAYTQSLSLSELQAMSTISKVYDNIIKTDGYYSDSQHWEDYNVSSINDEIYYNNTISLKNNLTLIRSSIIGKPFKLYSNTYQIGYDLNDLLDKQKFNKIYDSESVKGYI